MQLTARQERAADELATLWAMADDATRNGYAKATEYETRANATLAALYILLPMDRAKAIEAHAKALRARWDV